jgi:hypothetical protein
MSMIEIAPADVLPLEQFALAWRFTDASRADFAPTGLADLRPLRDRAAEALEDRLLPVWAAHHEAAADGAVWFDAGADAEASRAALAALPGAGAERVLVHWGLAVALETSWGTFVAHWDDFCYPGSDDVLVTPLTEAWVLCYHHWEEFSFALAPPAP